MEHLQQDNASGSTTTSPRNAIETLTREEIIQKYKSLLGIAKKAKQAKDDFAEENRQLKELLSQSETQKEADKKALITMKEMLEDFTANKLQMATQLSELQKRSKDENEKLSQLNIENESLKRQLDRLNDENEMLLGDIDRMENQLKQVNLLGMEQKQHLAMLEHEVNKLKEAESLNASLQNQMAVTLKENIFIKEEENKAKKALSKLTEKYKFVKSTNSEQCKKFNNLKDRFIDIYRKLKKLQECKRVLLETQQDYSESVSKWQNEIVRASNLLFIQMKALEKENEELKQRLEKLKGRIVTEHVPQNVAVDSPQKVENNEHTACKEDATKAVIDRLSLTMNELQQLVEVAVMEQENHSKQFEKVEDENKNLREQIEKTENQDRSEDFENLKLKLSNNEEALMACQMENKILKIKLENLEKNEEINLPQTIESLKIQLQQQEEVIKKLQKEFARAEDERNNLTEKLNKMGDEKSELLEKLKKLEELKVKKDELSAVVEELNRKLIDKENTMHEFLEREKLQATKAEAEEDRSIDYQSKCEDLQVELVNCRQSNEELQMRYIQKEREHSDLLDEMRELNEALKARGDVISRQQEKQQELISELRKTTTQLQQIENNLQDKEEAILVKEIELEKINKEVSLSQSKVTELEGLLSRNEDHIRVLNEEVQNLRAPGNDIIPNDFQSDALSTSTISRAEELNRLRELDDSFEDKYNKLRGLAMKLKKKLQEQTIYTTELEEKLKREQNDAIAELEDTRKKLMDIQTQQEQQQKQIESLKMENQKIKSSRKQTNVLNLEIEAAEKSLSEATLKLAAKMSELETLQEVLTTKENTVVQLRKEISILETAKAAECAHSKELKDQIDRLQAQIKDAVHGKQTVLTANKELEQMVENLKLELEDLRLQSAQNVSQQESLVTTAKNEKQQLELRLIESEDLIKSTKSSLKTAERALEDLRVEYLEYKVKAQAVLRNNQKKDTTKERELEEELLAVRAEEKKLQATIQTQMKKLEETDKQIELLQEDNASSQRRNVELLNMVEELRQQNETLAQENRTQLQMQQESLRNQRQQIEKLDACHKEQIKELEISYERQIDQLKMEHTKVKRLPTMIGAVAVTKPQTQQQQQQHHTLLSSSSLSDQNKIDLLLMEREDAEGSDEAVEAALAANRKISITSRRSHHDFMPLDELLNAPNNSIVSDTVTTISGNSFGRSNAVEPLNNFEYLQVELQNTKERLHNQESRIRHLTALLAENEQDLAKLTQMNDMLKEELRRQERSVEREQHMHNSEYLKNVILKFLTLNNADERTRLVPVLNTILKLSRAETETLNSAAKGQRVSTDGNRGWSNFLPTWGGSNNNHTSGNGN